MCNFTDFLTFAFLTTFLSAILYKAPLVVINLDENIEQICANRTCSNIIITKHTCLDNIMQSYHRNMSGLYFGTVEETQFDYHHIDSFPGIENIQHMTFPMRPSFKITADNKHQCHPIFYDFTKFISLRELKIFSNYAYFSKPPSIEYLNQHLIKVGFDVDNQDFKLYYVFLFNKSVSVLYVEWERIYKN